jgi:hypothetical protein
MTIYKFSQFLLTTVVEYFTRATTLLTITTYLVHHFTNGETYTGINGYFYLLILVLTLCIQLGF